jgi:hypothetical protein
MLESNESASLRQVGTKNRQLRAVVRTLLGPALRECNGEMMKSAGPAALSARRICWMTLVYQTVVERGHVHVIGTSICNEGPSGPIQPVYPFIGVLP